jgi:hypothetical protein
MQLTVPMFPALDGAGQGPGAAAAGSAGAAGRGPRRHPPALRRPQAVRHTGRTE